MVGARKTDPVGVDGLLCKELTPFLKGKLLTRYCHIVGSSLCFRRDIEHRKRKYPSKKMAQIQVKACNTRVVAHGESGRMTCITIPAFMLPHNRELFWAVTAAAPASSITLKSPTHSNSNHTLPRNTFLPNNSRKIVGKMRSNAETPTKIKYPSICLEEARLNNTFCCTILRFETATLIMMALQITNSRKTMYRTILKMFNIIGSWSECVVLRERGVWTGRRCS